VYLKRCSYIIPLTRKPQSWPLELSPVVGDEKPMVLLDTEAISAVLLGT